jgi:hypothetical protein
MAGTEFFERMGPQFAEQAGIARANVQRQADVERLISKAEYEYLQMCRDLEGLLPVTAEPRITVAAEPRVTNEAEPRGAAQAETAVARSAKAA